MAAAHTAPMRWRVRNKLLEWVRRYLPAEGVGIICAVIGGVGVSRLFGNPVLTALGGTWGETVGYYGAMLATHMKHGGALAGRLAFGGVPRAIRNLVIEFGGAECLDSFLVRPAA